MRNYTRLRNRGRRMLAFGSAPAAAWTPASLGSLAAWYTAGPTWCFTDAGGAVAAGDSDPVRVWKDRSGNARDLSQGTSANRPTLTLGGDGRWSVVGDGVNDYLSTAAFGAALAQPSTMAVVNDWPATGDAVSFSPASVGGGFQFFRQNTAFLSAYAGSILATTVSGAQSLAVYTAQINGASSVIRRDRVQVAAGDVGTQAQADIRLFSTTTAGTYELAGSITEVVFVNALLAAADLALLELYLKAAWGTP